MKIKAYLMTFFISMGVLYADGIWAKKISDFYVKRSELISINGTVHNNIVFAIRLDFLSNLTGISFDAEGKGVNPLINYADSNNIMGGNPNISFASINMTGGQSTIGPLTTNQPPVALIKSINGSIPEDIRWGDVNTSITGVVQADGGNLANNERSRFASNIDYTPLGANAANQQTLWVVPTINDSGAGMGQISFGARQIMNTIDSSIQGTSKEKLLKNLV